MRILIKNKETDTLEVVEIVSVCFNGGLCAQDTAGNGLNIQNITVEEFNKVCTELFLTGRADLTKYTGYSWY